MVNLSSGRVFSSTVMPPSCRLVYLAMHTNSLGTEKKQNIDYGTLQSFSMSISMSLGHLLALPTIIIFNDSLKTCH